MSNTDHTVLGAKGAVGKAVIHTLLKKGLPVKAVTRGSTVAGVPTAHADLRDAQATEKVVKGSRYVYLCIGLPYQTKVWQTQWELVMHNVIEACATHRAKLIFLDNIYMYRPPLPNPFDEQTPQGPLSEKGKARKRTSDLLLGAVEAGKVQAVIGRSADFYGAAAVNSPFYISFLERMLKGKTPQTLSNPTIPHTYADVTDNGRALVELALNEDCYGQVWHLPVGGITTTNEMLDLFNQVLGTHYKVSVLPGFLRNLLALFIGPLKEMNEMLYQFEQPYVLSDQKFRKRFPDFRVTTYTEGVQAMVAYFKAHGEGEFLNP